MQDSQEQIGQSNKFATIGIAVAAVFIVCTLLIIILRSGDPQGPTTTQPATSTFPVTPIRPPITRPTTTPPIHATSTPIAVPLSVTEEQVVLLQKRWVTFSAMEQLIGTSTKEYTLNYQGLFGKIVSTILEEPAAAARNAMEQELLSTLNITEAEACRMPIQVGRYTNLTPQGIQDIGLSFCPGSVSDEELTRLYVP